MVDEMLSLEEIEALMSPDSDKKFKNTLEDLIDRAIQRKLQHHQFIKERRIM